MANTWRVKSQTANLNRMKWRGFARSGNAKSTIQGRTLPMINLRGLLVAGIFVGAMVFAMFMVQRQIVQSHQSDPNGNPIISRP